MPPAGIAGDAGVRGTGQQPRIFVAMILILIFSEVRIVTTSVSKDPYQVLGLYGMIVALVLGSGS